MDRLTENWKKSEDYKYCVKFFHVDMYDEDDLSTENPTTSSDSTIDTDMYGNSYRASDVPAAKIASEGQGGLWDMSIMGERNLIRTAQKIMDRDDVKYPRVRIRRRNSELYIPKNGNAKDPKTYIDDEAPIRTYVDVLREEACKRETERLIAKKKKRIPGGDMSNDDFVNAEKIKTATTSDLDIMPEDDSTPRPPISQA